MSEMSKGARSAMRAKIARLVKTDPKAKVDASDYSPPDALDAGVKTGARPLSRRQFKKGGKVLKVSGEMAQQHAGRKPRKSGGKAITANSYINRDVREANEEREGKKHVGAFKKGGMVKHDDVAEDKKLIKKVVKPSALKGHDAECRCAKCGGGSAMKRGGRTRKEAGGRTDDTDISKDIIADAASRGLHFSDAEGKNITTPLSRKIDDSMQAVKDAQMQADYAKAYKEKPWARKSGGKAGSGSKKSVSDGKLEGTRPTGGRLARKHGGKTMKGATIIKIDISPKDKDDKDGMMGLGAGMPPAPVKPIAVAPPMPAGAGAPMPMPPPAGGMPPSGGLPPMGRKTGGRVGHRSYTKVQDMDAGSGSGLGRLEKIKIYGKKA